MRRRHRQTSSSEIDIAPLIDMVFILLIFFMVSTEFRSEDPREVVLPEAVAQEGIPERRRDIQNLFIEKDAVYINDRRVPVERISDVLEPIFAEHPRLVVSIRADVDVEYGLVNDVQEELREAGAVRVSFTTSLEREASRRRP